LRLKQKIGVLFVLLLLLGNAFGQVNTSLGKAALKALEKKKWAKAEEKIKKSITKDSLNPLGHFAFALYYFKNQNPAYDLENAYEEIINAATAFGFSSVKSRTRLQKVRLDSQRIVRLRKAIDSVTFKAIKQKNQEGLYIQFLLQHPYAEQRTEAIELRNEVAFLEAVNTNTYESFLNYLKKYPESIYAAAAQKRYDKLVYESMTKEGTLQAYENFLQSHPNTPFRKETEKNIFELYSISGDPEKFLSFVKRYPQSSQRKKATDILFHVALENEPLQWPANFLTDSLKQILNLQQNYLVPFVSKSRFGFMDKNGIQIIPPTTPELSDSYICGNITEDIIVLPDRLIARNGKSFFNGAVSELEDLGAGYLLVQYNGCQLLLHKSGLVIDSCVTNAKVLSNRFLSVTKQDKQFILSLAGRKILPEAWDDINVIGKVVILEKDKSYNILTLSELLEYAARGNRLFAHRYEQLKNFPDGSFLVSGENGEGVLDQDLSEVVPFASHKIQKTFFGYSAQSTNGFALYSSKGSRASHFDQLKVNEPWVGVSKNGERYLLDPVSLQFSGGPFDSLFFEGPFAIGQKSDTLIVHFDRDTQVDFVNPSELKFLPGKDSTSFLIVTSERPVAGKRKAFLTEEIKSIYNSKGKILFTEKFDDIQVAGNNLFIISRKEKKGLINSNEKLLLPIEFDAIGSVRDNTISVLKAMQFGLYNIATDQLIKPAFDKNVVPYGNEFVVAYRDGLYGFSTWDKIKDLNVEFEEVREWNDSVALVKKNQLWSLYDVYQRTIQESNIKEFKMIRDTDAEKIAIVERDNSFGVISNRRGTIIPVTFSDLINVGSAEEPLFFTEKHFAEALIFVVIYYDQNGKLIRREIYEEPEEYEKIYCGRK
jgi:hypothetical protein